LNELSEIVKTAPEVAAVAREGGESGEKPESAGD
jgi:hypothetical protein